jgi:heat shock protein HtpX
VSTGLLNRMNKQEVRGVLGHEVAHIANGDMVTMTLVQGVVNAFVMFLSRAIAYALTSGRDRDGESSSPWAEFAIRMGLEIVFMFLGSMVVAWFSRYREFRADSGGAKVAGRDSMIKALESLQRNFEGMQGEGTQAVQSLQISSKPGGFMKLFSTHPPLEERIDRLRRAI